MSYISSSVREDPALQWALGELRASLRIMGKYATERAITSLEKTPNRRSEDLLKDDLYLSGAALRDASTNIKAVLDYDRNIATLLAIPRSRRRAEKIGVPSFPRLLPDVISLDSAVAYLKRNEGALGFLQTDFPPERFQPFEYEAFTRNMACLDLLAARPFIVVPNVPAFPSVEVLYKAVTRRSVH